ncbi:MAG: class I SAM-dependent methyltransferase [Xenococcaceae cyanobacterium]
MTEYRQKWNSYWSQIKDSSEVFWNVPPSQGVGLDWERFKNVLKSANLPVIDFGCGDGTQTQFLREHFEQVIGLDISESALELASVKAEKAGLDITYEVVDNLEDTKKIHARFGDANIYMRGVLHQIQRQDRSLVAEQLKILLGKKGTLYLIELALDPHILLVQKGQKQAIPSKLKKVLECNIMPGEVSLEDLKMLFPTTEFSILKSGEALMQMEEEVDGESVQFPGLYAVITAIF